MSAHELALASSGAILFGYLTIGAFFWRFFAKTHERLFCHFAAAFWVLALERLLLLCRSGEVEAHPLVYATRLVAFLIIIWTIWDKNIRKAGN